MEAIQQMLTVTIFKLAKPCKWTPWIIGIYFLLLLAIAFTIHSMALLETLFVLYGMAVTYIVTVYGPKKGIWLAFVSYLLFQLPLFQHLMEQRREDFTGIVMEGILLPIFFLLWSAYIGKILRNSWQAAEKTEKSLQHMAEKTRQSERSLAGLMVAVSNAIEWKAPFKRGHSQRVAAYAVLLAKEIELTWREQKQLFYAALLHDIGKIGVSDAVLLKKGQLAPDEWVQMQLHPSIGKMVLEAVPGLEYVIEPIAFHHENLDGTGYPYGMRAKQIPISARIIAIADAFDAMTSERPYRAKMAAEQAIDRLYGSADIRFDRKLVDRFVEAMREREYNLMTDEDFNRCVQEFVSESEF
ncbi:HD-GYP domain-containing protein [Effusibacillus dendaii]|uniref:HD-GYP domain-containing protein n=1 Tax=Effusibacillus dendaii TaxID=2743772 RepID=A0A7I8DH65_9BACL|nr:HD-GYP domain-containing protein [Effusibacillus dendaii]BCJ87940.1 hypothetical protein skT53_29250 [Effusibacillus dendaii]